MAESGHRPIGNYDAPLPATLVRRGTTRCFVVKDRDGQKLAYVYFEDEPGRQHSLGRQKFRYVGLIAVILIVTVALCWGLTHI